MAKLGLVTMQNFVSRMITFKIVHTRFICLLDMTIFSNFRLQFLFLWPLFQLVIEEPWSDCLFDGKKLPLIVCTMIYVIS